MFDHDYNPPGTSFTVFSKTLAFQMALTGQSIEDQPCRRIRAKTGGITSYLRH
jgi:hypothetical protein